MLPYEIVVQAEKFLFKLFILSCFKQERVVIVSGSTLDIPWYEDECRLNVEKTPDFS